MSPIKDHNENVYSIITHPLASEEEILKFLEIWLAFWMHYKGECPMCGL